MADTDGNAILVAGGGIGGLTLALCLSHHGYHVKVFEQSPAVTEVGAGIQLSPNCTRVLHSLGLESGLKRVAFLPEGVEIRDWHSGQMLSSSQLGAHAIREYGYPYYHVHRADFIDVLANAVRESTNVELHTGSPVTSFQQTEAGVILVAGGQEVAGAALVGADGIHSRVREHLWGDDAPIFTGNVAWRGVVPANVLPAGLVNPVAGAWWGPGKHFVHYYLRRGELVNCVCVVEKTGWEEESWTQKGDHEELRSDFRGWHPTITTLIEHMDSDACFKWALFDRPPLARWSDGRVTLVGDACHPTLPFMAQGAAMAIEDAAVLSQCLVSAEVVPEALQRYESARRQRTAWVQRGSRRNARVFHMSGVSAWLRNRAVKRVRRDVMAELYSYDVYSGLR